MFRKTNRLYFLLAASLLLSMGLRAEDIPSPAGPGETPSSLSNPFVWIMILVILFLVIVIKSLSGVLLNAARNSWAEQSAALKEKRASQASDTITRSSGLPLLAVAAAPIVNGISNEAFYMLISVVGVEILVILYLLYNVNVLLKADKAALEPAAAGSTKPSFSFAEWWAKFNKLRPVQEEADLDTGHDYDGIRELDNKLPPWWKYGFYCTIIFAVIYLWRYHVVHSAPLPAEEFQIAMREADAQKEAYLKKSANNIDENNVKLLTSPADLAAGRAVFQTICFACHGSKGEGIVGPNLTDNYWLHGGTIQDVFKTIKYGWPDKGMKSWKDDYSPLQIAQIASYVKSLAGTNPPNAKAPQGVLVK